MPARNAFSKADAGGVERTVRTCKISRDVVQLVERTVPLRKFSRGLAQLVERTVRDCEAVSSNLTSPTKFSRVKGLHCNRRLSVTVRPAVRICSSRQMIINIIFLGIGLLILISGAEGLVRGSASLARKMGISPLVIGLTVVAFGTSAPELFVNLYSAFKGTADIAIGNIVGSNIFNIFLIL